MKNVEHQYMFYVTLLPLYPSFVISVLSHTYQLKTENHQDTKVQKEKAQKQIFLLHFRKRKLTLFFVLLLEDVVEFVLNITLNRTSSMYCDSVQIITAFDLLQ